MQQNGKNILGRNARIRLSRKMKGIASRIMNVRGIGGNESAMEVLPAVIRAKKIVMTGSLFFL